MKIYEDTTNFLGRKAARQRNLAIQLVKRYRPVYTRHQNIVAELLTGVTKERELELQKEMEKLSVESSKCAKQASALRDGMWDTYHEYNGYKLMPPMMPVSVENVLDLYEDDKESVESFLETREIIQDFKAKTGVNPDAAELTLALHFNEIHKDALRHGEQEAFAEADMEAIMERVVKEMEASLTPTEQLLLRHLKQEISKGGENKDEVLEALGLGESVCNCGKCRK